MSRLSNGLTVCQADGTEPGRFTAYVVVRVGSSHEPDAAGGLAHYLEHMMFKGTEQLGTLDGVRDVPLLQRMADLYAELADTSDPPEVARLLRNIDSVNLEMAQSAISGEVLGLYERMGAKFVSAGTSDEVTTYFCNLPVSRFRAWATLEAERLRAPVFRLFFTELEVVQEERRHLADDGANVRFDALLRLMFPSHTYGTHSPIGLESDLARPRFDLLDDFHQRWYRPNNAALVIVGDLGGVEVTSILEEEFGRWERQELGTVGRGTVSLPKARELRELQCPGPASVAMGWPMRPLSVVDRVRLDVLTRILWDGRAGRLSAELPGDTMARRPEVWVVHMTEASYLHVGLQLGANETHDELEQRIVAVVSSVHEKPVSSGELRRVLTAMELEFQWMLESDPQRAVLVAESFALGESWEDALLRLDLRRSVEAEDLCSLAETLSSRAYCVVHTRKGGAPPLRPLPPISPIPTESGRQSERARELLAIVDTQPRQAPPRLGTDYDVLPGDRGPVIWTRNEVSELFCLRLVFDQGFGADPLHVLRLAAAEVPTVEESGSIGAQLEGLGGVISHESGALTSYVEVAGLVQNVEALLGSLRVRLQRSRWPKEELTELCALLRGRYHAADVSATELARRAQDWLIYGARPPSAEAIDLLSSTGSTKLDGLWERGFATQFFGSTDVESLTRLLPAGGAAQRWSKPQLGAHEPAGIEIAIVDVPMESVELRVTFADRRGASTAAIDLHHAYLSNWSGLLNRELREKRSLVYHVGTDLPFREYDPTLYRLSVWANTSPKKVGETLKLTIALTCGQRLDEAALDASRAALLERLDSRQVSPRELAAEIFARHVAYGDRDPTSERMAQIETMLAPNVAAAAPEAGRATVVIVGDRSRMDLRALRKLGRVRFLSRGEVQGSSSSN
ncbi:M16 family metallopeptidase [Enhygromyxa salina]|uniref:M16 family metallopeptidase n=1 Tax=Enhygromyxa salina TaxID=215803 RepID=UPI0013FD085F|nr:pitrilysin family protein [Enhygromyxa salina]